MSIPTAVEKVFTEQQISYSTTNAGDASSSDPSIALNQIAKAIVLQDSIGKLQAVIPADCILDLSELCELLGRNLQGISPQELKELHTSLGVTALPAVPQMTGLPTIIDQRLLNQDTVYLEGAQENGLIELSKNDFHKLTQTTSNNRFSVEVQQHLDAGEPEGDMDAILVAIKNFTSLRIKQRLEETLEIPPLPDSAQKIIKLRADPDADMTQLSRVVETDPSLAAQVVSWAASPYYAAPGKIKSVQDAVIRVLGYDLVINLALGLALGKTLDMPKDAVKGYTSYWQQAVYVAATVQGLVASIPRENRPSMGLAYLAGLLSNFGYLILAHVFPPHFTLLCRNIEANPHVSHVAIERHLIGISREQLASWLTGLWHMPDEITAAIRHQHNPEYQGENAVYAKLIFLATRLLRDHGLADAPNDPIPNSIYEELNLDAEKANEVLERILSSQDDLNNIASNLDR